jgi:hypothetical protein
MLADTPGERIPSLEVLEILNKIEFIKLKVMYIYKNVSGKEII